MKRRTNNEIIGKIKASNRVFGISFMFFIVFFLFAVLLNFVFLYFVAAFALILLCTAIIKREVAISILEMRALQNVVIEDEQTEGKP